MPHHTTRTIAYVCELFHPPRKPDPKAIQKLHNALFESGSQLYTSFAVTPVAPILSNPGVRPEIVSQVAFLADRMQSKDFEWIVMAIRIQREVGGNLAELLNKVAETIREREYLERQVLTLSAEGRLSVWILGGLPPGFMLYLMVANPTYLEPLYTERIGIAMLITMVILETVGVLWMKKLVKVDV